MIDLIEYMHSYVSIKRSWLWVGTTTGFSVFNNIENVDKPLILWRSSSQWIGGLMFLLVTIGTIGSKQIKLKPSYLISGGASGRNFYNNYNYNFIKILLIYFSLTFFVIKSASGSLSSVCEWEYPSILQEIEP